MPTEQTQLKITSKGLNGVRSVKSRTLVIETTHDLLYGHMAIYEGKELSRFAWNSEPLLLAPNIGVLQDHRASGRINRKCGLEQGGPGVMIWHHLSKVQWQLSI